MQTIGSPSGEEVSLYFHIPFCTKKCPYCHFFVLPNEENLKQAYLKSLEKEWAMAVARLQGKRVVSIYFGGGTPSLIGSEAIEKILGWTRSLHIDSDCEITLEVNPENVSLPLMQGFQEAGINRVSLGVQSLDDSLLQTLERTHGAKQALSAIENTYNAGITNISIDLMFDLPGQSLKSWEATLRAIGELPISHLSLYNLVFEPNTPFFKKKKELSSFLPTSEESVRMLTMAVEHLERAGLRRYEISAFAKEGFFSRHNTGYWTARPFLGLGPSAFSYFNKKRFRNVANLSKYAAALERGTSPVDFEEELPYPQNIQELFAVELRLLYGVELTSFERRHGKLPSSLQSTLEKLTVKGWLKKNNDLIKLTEEGLLFYDSAAEEII